MYLVFVWWMWSHESIARGHGLAAPSTRLPRAALRALLAGLPSLIRVGWISFGAWLLGQINMIASGLLNLCRCCALRLEGKSQVGIIFIFLLKRVHSAICIIVARLPKFACASMRVPWAPCWIASEYTNQRHYAFLTIIIIFIMGWLQPDSMR